MESISNPWVITTGVVGLAIAILTLIIRVFKERIEHLKDQIEHLKHQLKQTKIWAERNENTSNKEKNELTRKVNELEDKLKTSLIEAGINIQSYDILKAIENVKIEFKDSVRVLTEQIEYLKIENDNDNFNFEFYLSLAKAFATNREWEKAANQFEKLTRIKSTSWELHFSQGVTFANSRSGKETNLKALQSYCSAIFFLPENVNTNTKARLYIYKGALLKRLSRLDEAEFYVKQGLKHADANYEINDGLYNLACVYAMQNKEIEYAVIAKTLKSKDISLFDHLLDRLDEYAPAFKEKNCII